MKIPRNIKLGHPALLLVAQPVDIHPETLDQLANGLDIAMRRLSYAVGLALPQLGVSLRGFMLVGKVFDQNRHRFCFNPTIRQAHGSTYPDFEGCFSLPGEKYQIARHLKIDVTYFDRKGNEVEEQLKGMQARAFQHELDHLDGILINDKRRQIRVESVLI